MPCRFIRTAAVPVHPHCCRAGSVISIACGFPFDPPQASVHINHRNSNQKSILQIKVGSRQGEGRYRTLRAAASQLLKLAAPPPPPPDHGIPVGALRPCGGNNCRCWMGRGGARRPALGPACSVSVALVWHKTPWPDFLTFRGEVQHSNHAGSAAGRHDDSLVQPQVLRMSAGIWSASSSSRVWVLLWEPS